MSLAYPHKPPDLPIPVLDDAPFALRLICFQLRKLGHQALHASQGMILRAETPHFGSPKPIERVMTSFMISLVPP
jgi:hypothetical protein